MSRWPSTNKFGSPTPRGWAPKTRDPETSLDESQVAGPSKSSGQRPPTYHPTILPPTTDVSFSPAEPDAWFSTDTAQSPWQVSNSIGPKKVQGRPNSSLERTKNTADHWPVAFPPLGLADAFPTFFGPTETSLARTSNWPQTHDRTTSPTETPTATPDSDFVLTPCPYGDLNSGLAKSETKKYFEVPDFALAGSENDIAFSSLSRPIQQREDMAAHLVSSISSVHGAIPEVAYPTNDITNDTAPQQEELMPRQLEILCPYIDPLTSRVTCPYIDPITGNPCCRPNGSRTDLKNWRIFERHYSTVHVSYELKCIDEDRLLFENALALNSPWAQPNVHICEESACKYKEEHDGERWSISSYKRIDRQVQQHKQEYHPHTLRGRKKQRGDGPGPSNEHASPLSTPPEMPPPPTMAPPLPTIGAPGPISGRGQNGSTVTTRYRPY